LEKLNRGILESRQEVQQRTMNLAQDYFGDSAEALKQLIKDNRATLKDLPDQIPGGREEVFQALFQELMDNYSAMEECINEARENVANLDTDQIRRLGEVEATDAARRQARELGIDLTEIEGTGANGRITADDVKKVAETMEDGDAGEEPKASEAAKRRAEELGIDLSQVEGTGSGGQVTVKDITSLSEEAMDQATGQATDQAGQVAGQAQEAAGGAAQQAQDAAGQVAGQAQQVAGQATDQAGQVAGQATDQVGQVAGQAQDAVGGATQQAQDTAGQVTDQAGQAVQGVQDTVGGLTGGLTGGGQQQGGGGGPLGGVTDQVGQVAGQAQQAVGQAAGQAQETAGQAAQQAGQATGGDGAEEPKVTNAARRKAQELGVDLSTIEGTGSGGLITMKDVTGS
jgi:pyruvate/2-oxoglutarate dehydrogenase complex dihydrolipoamide acyltransferase (E2) component